MILFDEVRSFSSAVLDTYDLNGFDIDLDLARECISDEIAGDFNELNSQAIMEKRFERFQVDGSRPEDYCERLIEISNGQKVISGIRHMGCNPKMPFVYCIPSFVVSCKSTALFVYNEIKEYFEVFSPNQICFYSNRKVEADFYGSVYLINSARLIKDNIKWAMEDEIELVAAKDDSYFDWYVEGYEEFHKDFIDLKWKVTVNSLEIMRDSLEQGLLSIALYRGQRIGLIAAIREPFLGGEGFYFNEIFISKNWKGLGLAKVIQRKFIEQNANPSEIVWGTIDHDNLASYKTAIANARKPIRYECYYSIKDES